VVLYQVSTGCVNLRPRYRVRQFWGALGSGAKPVEEAVLRTHLNTAQIALFRRMSVAEQAHALAVLHTLQKHGYKLPPAAPRRTRGPNGGRPLVFAPGQRRPLTGEYRPAGTSQAAVRLEQVIGAEPALAQAALLHDVGKVEGRIRLWHRVATVLLQALRPALLCHLALNEPHSWRYPFFVSLHHAEHGADLSAEAGTDAVAVALIRAHHTAPEQSGWDAPSQALLTALRWADEQN
jgi:hypothetical protein